MQITHVLGKNGPRRRSGCQDDATFQQSAVTAPIIGARNLDQLKDSLAAVNMNMTPELRAEIAELSRTPPPATDRSEEQRVVKS